MRLFKILPPEIVNIIYQLAGGIRKFVPDKRYLDYTDFSYQFISSIPNETLYCSTKSQLKMLYDMNKLILYNQTNYSQAIALTEDAYMYVFPNGNQTHHQCLYKSVENMIRQRDNVIANFFN